MNTVLDGTRTVETTWARVPQTAPRSRRCPRHWVGRWWRRRGRGWRPVVAVVEGRGARRARYAVDRVQFVHIRQAMTKNLAFSANYFRTGIFMAFLVALLAIG